MADSKPIGCGPAKWLRARQKAGIQANGWDPGKVKTKICVKMLHKRFETNYAFLHPLLVAKVAYPATFLA